MSEIAIFDESGTQRSPEWLAINFGDVLYRRPAGGGPGWRLIELRARVGAAALISTLRGSEENPGGGVKVARCWSGDICGDNLYSPDLSHHDPLPAELATWFDRGVWGPAEPADAIQAAIGYGIGKGDAYNLRDHLRGASAIWPEGNSDQVLGLGWIVHWPDGSLTDHRCLETVFAWGEGDDPGPGGGDWIELASSGLIKISEGLTLAGAGFQELAEAVIEFGLE